MLKSKLKTIVLGLGLGLLSMQAGAVTITFGGQTASDGSGLTSSEIDPSNIMNPTSGYFVETFDQSTQNPWLADMGLTGTTAPNPATGITIQQNSGCSINSFGAVGMNTTGGGVEILKGSSTKAAAPAGDSTCYAVGPQTGSSTIGASLLVDYRPLMATLAAAGLAPADAMISYLGLYYGSIDWYNNIEFYTENSLGTLDLMTGEGLLADGILDGDEILGLLSGTSGDRSGAGSNVYVNLFFDPDETFAAFKFVNHTHRAFELDNIVVGLDSRPMPLPAPLALLGLGLIALAFNSRKKAV